LVAEWGDSEGKPPSPFIKGGHCIFNMSNLTQPISVTGAGIVVTTLGGDWNAVAREKKDSGGWTNVRKVGKSDNMRKALRSKKSRFKKTSLERANERRGGFRC